ncbi:MAG: carboxypeptidase regulatory-like domain-containing protein, partial [Dehalococcoidia bacterium]|nr:carboxypeptidase regulatory-like domain-containing protein [Dehalococcoidia bacterium]
MKSIPRTRLSLLMLVCVAAVIALALAGCTGATGPAGPPGPNGSAGPAGAAGAAGAVGSFNAAVSGTVTNGSSAAPLAGATVATVPAIAGLTIQTKADGTYSATVPAGAYTLTISKTNYTSATISVNVAAGQTVNTKTTLAPNGKVIVSGTALTAQAPGASISIPAVVDALDGSTATTYKWSQVSGATATITDGATATAKVTLPNAAAYKAELVKNLKTLDRT